MAKIPNPINHLRGPDGVAFPLRSCSRRSELVQVNRWMAQMALISLRFPENRQLSHLDARSVTYCLTRQTTHQPYSLLSCRPPLPKRSYAASTLQRDCDGEPAWA